MSHSATWLLARLAPFQRCYEIGTLRMMGNERVWLDYRDHSEQTLVSDSGAVFMLPERSPR